ncbi:hypothetical protein AJ80_03284 [Polytolypa hystricis UAMH7299]|uniref:Uncharacterized protein n=1 Tax=Polytolypa hystricis (strain UAMH7299) TaxID=1447883 RepID=A0A2B7YL89_POLH7|nr:hypothetical protein AJ80_03284 [Polytolypa hystricis UAMH7299]
MATTTSCTTDVDALWKAAVDRYEQVTAVKIDHLSPAKCVDDILQEIHDRESRFKTRRHDGSKLDRFRTLVGRSLVPIEKVGDVLSQASSNAFQPSAAIFTAVKYLISATNSVSADYDKLIEFFEDLDLYLNRLKVLEKRISPIPELKAALVDVLTSVLVLCGISAKYIKTKRIVKAFRNLVSGEDDELQVAYSHFHKMVEHEGRIIGNATLAAVEQLRTESSEGNKAVLARAELVHRHLESMYDLLLQSNASQLICRAIGREVAAERERIMKGLSTLTFHAKQRDTLAIHQEGTNQWVLQSNEFQAWFKDNKNSTLWCHGIPGGGKTVITSVVVNYVSEAIRGTNAAVAYLYCDYKNPETHAELQLLSSIARQLVEQIRPIPPEVSEFLDRNAEKKRNPTEDEWVALVKSLCLLFQNTYLFVDALDECPERNRDNFVRIIKKLEACIRFLFTSRPHIDLPVKFTNLSRIAISASKSDLETFLESGINRSNRLSKFVSKDPSLKGDIFERLEENATGMFLLAHLQMDFLCRQNNLKQVRKAMSTLPMDIDEFYDDAMRRVKDQGSEDYEFARKAISYIFCAKRPFHVLELCHALAVEAGDTELDEDAFPEMEILLNVSAGLIKIDDNSSTIGFVHYTLQEYFEKHPENLLPDPDTEIASVCLAYLSFDALGSGPCSDGESLKRRLEEYRLLDYATNNWGHHCKKQLSEQVDMALTYLGQPNSLSSSIQVLYATSYRRKDWYDRFPKQFGPLHAGAYWCLDKVLEALLQGGIEVDIRDSYGATALVIAAKHGHRDAVQILLNNRANINAKTDTGETALYWAARKGHSEIVTLLLRNGADAIMDDEGWSGLHWAVVRGNIEVATILLESGVELDGGRDGKIRALYLAAEEKQEVMVQMLIDSGVDVNAGDSSQSRALDFATVAGHEPTIRALLEGGAGINLRDAYYNSALHWAVSDVPTARLLLENGADIHAKNDQGQTPLCWTAQGESVEVAQLLLDYKADVNLKDVNGITALHRASLKGCEAMVNLLIEHGASPNAEDKDGWTPLHGACVNQHKHLVPLFLDLVKDGRAIVDSVDLQKKDPKKRSMLAKLAGEKQQGSTVVTDLRYAAQEGQVGRLQMMLDKGANINGKDAAGYTALETSIFENREEAVRVLLENGADVNLRGSSECSPLHLAIEHSTGPIVQLLIDYEADANAMVYGSTSLILAASLGKSEIVQSLIRAGAGVNLQDLSGQTALHVASSKGWRVVLQSLIDEGASLDVVDDCGRTALMLAVEKLQSATVKLLLNKEVSVNARAQDGSTALHLAAFKGDLKNMRLLLSAGAEVDALTQNNFTALHIVTLAGSHVMVRLLLKYGADTTIEADWSGLEEADGHGAYSEDRAIDSWSWTLHDFLLEQRDICYETDATQRMSARHLALAAGHVEVQRILDHHDCKVDQRKTSSAM